MSQEVDVFVLAGGPRPAPTAAAVGQPAWLFPLSSSRSVLQGWLEVCGRGFDVASHLRMRSAVAVVSRSGEHVAAGSVPGIEIRPEARSHRGTAGVVADELRDREDDPDGLVLVIEASASPAVSLGGMLGALDAEPGTGPDCVVGESDLGRFCGVLFCRRSFFNLVPDVGFFDLKEQFLASLRAESGVMDAVRVADRARNVRTRSGWLSVVAAWRRAHESEVRESARQIGDGESRVSESLVVPTATILGGTVMSSIVMDHAVIEEGAVVARSIIGPGMRIKAGSRVIDAIVSDADRSSARSVDSATRAARGTVT